MPFRVQDLRQDAARSMTLEMFLILLQHGWVQVGLTPLTLRQFEQATILPHLLWYVLGTLKSVIVLCVDEDVFVLPKTHGCRLVSSPWRCGIFDSFERSTLAEVRTVPRIRHRRLLCMTKGRKHGARCCPIAYRLGPR